MSEERHAPTPPPLASGVGAPLAAGASAPLASAVGAGADGAIDVALDAMDPGEGDKRDKHDKRVPRDPRDPSPHDGIDPEKKGSLKPPDAPPSSQRPVEPAVKRARAKVTLKIPDDEVSRPQLTPSAPPAKVSDYPPPAEGPLVPMKPMRIISIESPPAVVKASIPPPVAPLPPVAPPPPKPPATLQIPVAKSGSGPEDSWTPYQPTVADRAASAPLPPVAPVPRPQRSSQGSIPAAPITPQAAPPRPDPSPSPPVAFVPPAPATAPMPLAPPTEPRSGSMDDILIVTDDAPPSSGEIEIEDERPTSPGASLTAADKPAEAKSPEPKPAEPKPAEAKLAEPKAGPIAPSPPRVEVAPLPGALAALTPAAPPVAPPPVALSPALPLASAQPPVTVKDLPPMRALAPTEPEGLEVHFEDEDPVSSPRNSEPEAEIALEDLVSVESAPSPTKQLAAKPIPPSETPTPARGFFPVGAVGAPANAPASVTGARISANPASSPKPAAAPKVARVIVPTASPLAPPPMSEVAATGRRKARPWWEELFNDDFIRTMAKVTDEQIAKEVEFVEESLAVAKGAMLLDLGCGTGRHAIELTRRGYKVVGFDLSLPMLAKAAEEAQERNQKLNFVQGDMREMTFEDTFDGIYCWNTTFGFFEEEKNAQVIQRVHKALKKGGQFMLEVGNRDYIIRQAPSLAWFEGDGCICMDEMSIDWITSRMKVKRTMMMDDGRTKEIDYSIRIYSLHELGRILHESGFRVAEVSGRTGTPGVYFGNESPRTMILAEKK